MNIRTSQTLFIFFLLFSCAILRPDEEYEKASHFGTHTVYHENGDATVTHEHSGSTDNWDYKYSATFEHVTYDTTEFTTMTHAEFTCTPREDVDSSVSDNHNDQSEIPETSHDNNHEQSSRENNGQDQDDDTDYNEYLKDMAMDRGAYRVELQNNQSTKDDYNTSHQTVPLISSYDDDTQRSMVYQVCKSIKESLLGKSKRTKDRQQAQKIAKEQETARKKAQQEIEEAHRLHQHQELTSELEQAYEQHQKALSCSNNQDFLKIMHSRDDPFEASLQHQKPKKQNNKLAPSTIGFLQAHNINYSTFLQLSGVAIQHHLTQELIENINVFATLADVHFSNSKIFPLIQSGVLVSGVAQDYNQAKKICDAMSATNCSHGFLNYVQGILDSGITCCAKFATALSFFNCEVAQYTLAAARGIAHGIVASEVSGIILSGLNMLAPGLTSVVYAGATSVLVPIALTAGFLCSAALTTELARCGYLYTTDQYENLEQELDQIKNFAQQFYNFDQAPVQHVENIATLATTLVWPSQRQAIFEYLMDMQKVTCNVWLDAKNFVSQTRVATQNQLHNAFESIKNNELTQFQIIHKKIFDEHVFDLFSTRNPGLVPAGMQNLINPSDQNRLVQLLMAQESSAGGNAVRAGISQGIAGYITEFSETDVGKKMYACAIKDYEKNKLTRIAKEYGKAISNQAPQEVVDRFLRCYELSIMPVEVSEKLESLHVMFKDKYPGLPEFSHENKYLMLQVKHIFYPTIEPKLDRTYQKIDRFVLNGFHHDEYGALEKSGLFTFVNKEYGKVDFEAQECFIATLNFGSEIITKIEKTFFPSNWSIEKVAKVVFEAFQNRVEDLTETGSPNKKFLCKFSSLFIEIILDKKNVITSAYPSKKNFRI